MPDRLSDLQAKLLEILRQNGRAFVSAAVLAQLVDLPAADLPAQCAELEELGCPLERDNSGAIRLANADPLLAAEIEYRLKTEKLGRVLHQYGDIGSTNIRAAELAESGAPEGTLVLADRQLHGKGRLSRNWHSPSGVGIYQSLVLRPKMSAAAASGISLVAALALVETIENLYSLQASIKWPNDILLDGRKLAGILTELTSDGDRVRHIILGIGINCNQTKFPAEIAGLATSLRLALGHAIVRVELLCGFLHTFENLYQQMQQAGLIALLPQIKAHSAVLGKRISFRSQAQARSGIAVDIDPSGMLIVESGGAQITLAAGEITLEDNY
ncbi:MAG: biotin--[acetyl-CoA-carboxylase] ligase [bacterium]